MENELKVAKDPAPQPEAVEAKQQVLSHFEVSPKTMELIFATIGKRPWLEIDPVIKEIQGNVKPVFK